MRGIQSNWAWEIGHWALGIEEEFSFQPPDITWICPKLSIIIK
ncbi:hypothetical protein GXM_06132 [Nostoc sphaeroides CCNUC1]|uniref:Uncharacterized protein n=1 Tax=Nostoc sphaeroides CCNUC1 TaxID=2653204 RepID=A0A5P8W7C6_9NOSO|nr:hypothetical protein GXM_06132 [Nostoc sphaeroides CCNUC1]